MGGVSRLVPIGLHVWDKSLGDAAYATMIYFLVAFVRPAWQPRRTGALALAVCVAIECFQYTGIPLRLPRLLQIALGTTFAWHDRACYAVGTAIPALVLGAREPSSRGPPAAGDGTGNGT